MDLTHAALYLFLCHLQITFALDFVYHTNEELKVILNEFPQTVSKPLRAITQSIGTTTDGNDLWVTEITATRKDALNIPNVKLIANIHGNEAVGRVVLLHFLHFLRDAYMKNNTITRLLNNTRIHIMPSMNPNGFNRSRVDTTCTNHGGGRENGKHNYDLNRNFPDYFYGNFCDTQPETAAIIRWMQNVPFILSASLHGGALVANYPFDTVKEKQSNYHIKSAKSVAPDDDVFIHLAKTYANNHQNMHLGNVCSGRSFDGGITNGAEWYTFTGSMQDYNYFKHGSMELTLEISCCKYPEDSLLEGFWKENKEALIAYCLEAHRGIAGQVLDEKTRLPIGGAKLEITHRPMPFYSIAKTGEYRRLLLPGRYYTIKVEAEGYHTTIKTFYLTDDFPIMNIYLTNSSFTTSTSATTTVSTQPSTSANPSTDYTEHILISEPEEMPLTGAVISSTMRCCQFSIVFLLLTCVLLLVK